MTAKADFQKLLEKIDFEDIKGQIDDMPVGPEAAEEAEDYEFRPLTKEEKEEFLNSLDAKGKQILAELEGKRTGSTESAEEAAPLLPPIA